jgi:hypothetical protein
VKDGKEAALLKCKIRQDSLQGTAVMEDFVLFLQEE